MHGVEKISEPGEDQPEEENQRKMELSLHEMNDMF